MVIMIHQTISSPILDTDVFSTIRVDAISEQIGEGINHLVFKYKKNQVIKIPKKKGPLTYSTSQLLRNDLKLLNSYFPHLAVTTEVVDSDTGTEYCLIQDFFVNGKEISSDSINDVRFELEKILAQNKKLYTETGHSLDLFGSAGFKKSLLGLVIPGIKPHLSNLLMKKSGDTYKVYLVDIELLRLRVSAQEWSSVPLWLQSWVSFYLTSFLLKFFFKFS